MAEKNQEIIIVKRRGGGHDDGHHGGVWKIAFADFMTAMMAFFLVLWIVNSTSKATRSSVARYFNPVKLTDTTPTRKGLSDPKDVESSGSPASQSEGDKAQADDKKESKDTKDAKAAKESKAGKDDKAAKESKAEKDSKADKAKAEPPAAPHPRTVRKPGPVRLVDRTATFSEALILEDPQGVLTDIVSADDGMPLPVEASSPDGAPPARIARGFRDPFEPIAAGAETSRILRPGASDAKEGDPNLQGASADGRDRHAPLTGPGKAVGEKAGGQKVEPSAENQVGDARATSQDGAVKPEGAQKRQDVARNVEQQVRAAVAAQFGQALGPGVSVKLVEEGVLLSLTDSMNFEMFAVSSSEPHPRLVKAMGELASVLQKQSGRLVIRGHTDARPFRTGKSDNWRLSAARAQMTFQMLVRGGFEEKRLERIEGHAARHLRNPSDPFAPENRRIELLLQL